MAKTITVERYLAESKHSRKDEIMALRAAVLKSHKDISEHIKWNAPSFLWKGGDRVTMRLQPGDRLELVFHRGAKPKSGKPPKIPDTSEMITWVASDRGVLSIKDASTLKSCQKDIVRLILEWMIATE